jgi:lipoate-protein ligase A
MHGPSACFAALSPFEATVAGVKVIGSAQVRRGRAFLQQGSLRLTADEKREARLLGEARPSLSGLLGRPTAYAEAAAALRRAFAQALGICFEDSTLTLEEERLAQSLEEIMYASPAWTWDR